jgi:hypothetical protein
MPAFIETQFPIARLSAESYKERKANNGQTLTRLGKWWGRKPLILVRASILGMLMPASADAKKDREIFLKILTMDDDGAWRRCKPTLQRRTSADAFAALPCAERIAECERPHPGRQYLRDTFGQGYWGRRERFIGLLEWLAALGNAAGMHEWSRDSEAARFLAGRLRNDQA